MDTINLVTLLTGAAAVGAYLTLDYKVSRSATSLANAINQRPNILKLDKNLFQTDIERIIPSIGIFSYYAKKYYRNVIRQN